MIIGLTGGIASGKSTVSRLLDSLGAIIIDADKIAREVVEPGEKTWHRLKEAFGQDIFYDDGKLNRPKLGEIIFSDGQAREKLNSIIHPAIRARMVEMRDQAVREGEELVVLDIPLLFESKLEYMVEKILVVYVPEEIQLQRLMSRDGIDRETALKKMKSQMPIEQKRILGDACINNSGTIEETKAQLLKIIKQWRQE